MESNSSDLIGKWGWISIESEYFRTYLHEECIKVLGSLQLSDYVFQCLEILPDNYVRVKSTETELLLRNEAFRLMPEQPTFLPLERVKFFNSKGVLEFGIIKEISWHNNDRRHIYSIEVNDMLKTRRYYAEDLDHMN